MLQLTDGSEPHRDPLESCRFPVMVNPRYPWPVSLTISVWQSQQISLPSDSSPKCVPVLCILKVIIFLIVVKYRHFYFTFQFQYPTADCLNCACLMDKVIMLLYLQLFYTVSSSLVYARSLS